MAEKKKTCELFDCGHRACGGCGAALAARLVTQAAGTETIVVNSTGCMEVFSTPYPGDRVEGPVDPLPLRERFSRCIGYRGRAEKTGAGKRRS